MSVGRHITERASDVLAAFLERSEAISIVLVDDAGRISSVNRTMASVLGGNEQDFNGRAISEILTDPDGKRLQQTMRSDLCGPGETVLLNFVDAEHSPHTLECSVARTDDSFVILGERKADREELLQKELLELTNTLAVLSRENIRKGREVEAARAELEKTLDELKHSYWHLKKIQEVLPICMECGKVKTSEASWESVLEYLQKNSLFLSHGYCPSCASKLCDEIRSTQRIGGPK